MVSEWDYWAKLSLLFSGAFDGEDRVRSKRGWCLFLDYSRVHSKDLRFFVDMLISEGVLLDNGDGLFVLGDWVVLQRLLAVHPAVKVLEIHFSMVYRQKLKF